MNLDGLLSAIKADEGRVTDKRGRHVPYKCPADKLTIGYGRNIQDNGISESEALNLLTADAIQAYRDAADLVPNWARLDDVRQNVVANMAFNMGKGTLAKFKKFLAAVDLGQYGIAAAEMTSSRWYLQTGKRAQRLQKEMLTGKVE